MQSKSRVMAELESETLIDSVPGERGNALTVEETIGASERVKESGVKEKP